MPLPLIIAGALGAAGMGASIYQAVSQPDYAGMAASQERQRQAAINQGMGSINQAFQGYTPEFYNQRAKAYEQYAMPQLSQQYQNAYQQTMYGLMNRGLQGSSSQTKAMSDLARVYGQAQQTISDTGRSQAQQLQQQVENARNTAISQLYQSADPAGAAQMATQSAAQYSAPSAYAPLSNMFSSIVNQYLANQIMNQYNPSTGMMLTNLYGSGAQPWGQVTPGAPLPNP